MSKPKVRTLKWKKERIKYTIVNCMEQEVVNQINESNVDSILALTKKVIKKRTSIFKAFIPFLPIGMSFYNRYRLSQGYNLISDRFRRKNRKLSTILCGFICLPKLILLGHGIQTGVVKGSGKANGVKLAFPME